MMTRAAPHVFLVAGEESGDRLGAALIAALKRGDCMAACAFSGVGGAQMAAQGLASLFPLGDLAIIGFAAIPARLPTILRAHPRDRRRGDRRAARRAGDHRQSRISPIAWRAACAHARRHIPIVDYVCPSVWAWRPGRARAMRAYVDQVLALLPFEPEAHAPARRAAVRPMSAIRWSEQVRRSAAERRRRRATAGRPAACAGAAGQPFGRDPPHGGDLRRGGGAGGRARRPAGGGGAGGAAARRQRCAATVAAWPVPAAHRRRTGPRSRPPSARARAALTKSGTSTLELALAGVPMVAAYRVPLLEEVVARAMITALER